ncbi:MAG: ferritin family protein [Deltaproteobacteria bacterium]|nr:ferritin family protein [Deltaproteobacteria bacterium]
MKTKWECVDEVLDYAIAREQEAIDFYTELASKVDGAAMKKMFEQFSREEAGHKKRLQRIKEDKSLIPAERQVMDLKVADYTVDVMVTTDMSHQDALILAMKREKAAFRLYTDLAGAVDDARLEATFLALAQEEAKHKLRFEIEYDDRVLTEN